MNKTNGVKLFALVAVLAMVFAGTAVMFSDENVDAAGELNLSGTINGNQQSFEDGAVGVMNGNLLIEEGKSLIIGDGAKFTVQSNYTLTIDKTAKLIIEQGAEFIVDGNIVVKNGGIIQNNAMSNGFQLNGSLNVEKGGVVTNYTATSSAPTCTDPQTTGLSITQNESFDVATGEAVENSGSVSSSNGVYTLDCSNTTYHMNAVGDYGYWVGVKITGTGIEANKTYDLNIDGKTSKTTTYDNAIYLYTVAGKVLDVTISGDGITTPYHFVLDMRTSVGIDGPAGQIVVGADAVVDFNSTKSTPSSVSGQIFTLKEGASLNLDTIIGAPKSGSAGYDAGTIVVETVSGKNSINASVTLEGTGAVTDMTFGTEVMKAGTVWTDLDRNGEFTDKNTRYNYNILTVSGDVGNGVELTVNSSINKIVQPNSTDDDAPAGVSVFGIVKVAEGQKLTVGENATMNTLANSMLQIIGSMEIDGKKASADETQTDVDANITFAGVMDVSGTIDFGEFVNTDDEPKPFFTAASAYLIVTGKVTFDESVDIDEIIGQLKGLYGVTYVEEVSSVDVPTISTLDAAVGVSDVSEITISGYPADAANNMLAKPFEISADVTLPETSVIINNTVLVAEGATLTISESTDLECDTTNGGLIVVEGTVIDYTMEEMEYSGTLTANELNVNAEVRFVDADETYYMYTTLASALAGDAGTIALFGDVDISKNTTIPAGFTIELNGRTLTIEADAELTVEGVIDSSTPEGVSGTSTISIKTETGKDDGVLTLRNMIVNPNISSGSGFSTVAIGAFSANGTIGDYENADFLLAPSVAAANSATLYEMTSQGKITNNGTLTFATGEDNEGEVVTIDSTVSITKIVLNGYGFTVTSNGEFTGTVETSVTAGASSVAFDKVKGYTVGVAVDQSGDVDVTEMTLSASSATGGVTIATGTVALASDVTFGDVKTNVLTIASGATLVVPETFGIEIANMYGVNDTTADKDKFVAVTVDGTLNMEDGTNLTYAGDNSTPKKYYAIVEINGTMNVAGDITVYGDFYVDGTLAISTVENEEGSVTVGETMYVNGTVAGAVEFESENAVVLAYPGSSVDTANMSIVEGETIAKAMEVYVNGELYMTVYGLENVNVQAALQKDSFDITGYADVTWPDETDETTATVWYSDAEYQNTIDITTSEIGETPDVYVKLNPLEGKVQVSVGPQMTVFIDGVKISSTGVLYGSQAYVGDHKIEVTINPGFTGDISITFNGQTISNNGTFTITPEMADAAADYVVLSVTGNLSQESVVVGGGDSNDDSGLGLTDYLLIILVILIVIMAIMVAARLMRS